MKRLCVWKAPGGSGQGGASLLAVLMGLVCLAVVAVAGWLAWWVQAPLALRLPPGATVLDVKVAAGSSAQRAVRDAVAAGVAEPVWLLQSALRLSGQDGQIKAGSYELPPGITPLQLLDKLVRGDTAVRSVTVVEGWTFMQMRAALQKAEHLTPDTQALGAENIMKLIGRAGQHPEGRFFPDTYVYPKGSSDVDVWRQAATAMDRKLSEAWGQRDANLPLTSPDEALILASIIEKETG
ncbi:MAG: endolytic transglycosylase MltG, partial [Burkholderiales bacterium]|nr:endolytic transglycosylase MltG [Burkholderiales bacterium]